MSMMNEGAPPPDEVDEPAEAGEPAKQSQQEADYREGNPQRSCGLCGHFDSKGHSCDVVEGDISPFGFSDRYLRQDNPFREGEKEVSRAARQGRGDRARGRSSWAAGDLGLRSAIPETRRDQAVASYRRIKYGG